MKTMRTLMLSTMVCVLSAPQSHADLILGSETARDSLHLMFDSQPGTNYQFCVSTNLSHWDDWGTVIVGDGLSKTQIVSTLGPGMAFFRVQASPSSGGVSPSDAEFTALVVGKTILNYSFLSATRFSWSDESGLEEDGNWDYTKTGGSTGKVVFTYDPGNDPAVYREEVVMTFQTSTQGTYRYWEFLNGVETFVSTGGFDLGGP